MKGFSFLKPIPTPSLTFTSILVYWGIQDKDSWEIQISPVLVPWHYCVTTYPLRHSLPIFTEGGPRSPAPFVTGEGDGGGVGSILAFPHHLTLSLPRVINFKFPLQPHQNILSHSMKNLAFHSLLRWKMITLPILTSSLIDFSLKGWENILFGLSFVPQVKSSVDYWTWVSRTLVPSLYPWRTLYGYPQVSIVENGDARYVVGVGRVRQLRIKKGTANLVFLFFIITVSCRCLPMHRF